MDQTLVTLALFRVESNRRRIVYPHLSESQSVVDRVSRERFSTQYYSLTSLLFCFAFCFNSILLHPRNTR